MKKPYQLLIHFILYVTIFFNTSSDMNGQNLSGYAPVNGLQLYYEIHGTGDMPLVLIHGGGSTIETTFGYILPLLAAHDRVIAVELQAHGHSGDRETGLSFEQDADDVAALLKYLKITKADFFGFSNGGNTAMQIGIKHPDLVNKLVIASSFYKRNGMIPGFFEGMKHAGPDNMPEPLKTAYLKVAPDKNHMQVMHDKDRDRMVEFKDWPDEMLRSIDFPTLIINGNHDVVTVEHALEMSHVIPNAELLILPGNHGSYIGEVCSAIKDSNIPVMVVSIIKEFLKTK